jgi:thiamine phosphate synthase YjbQ (UPF0047 family)
MITIQQHTVQTMVQQTIALRTIGKKLHNITRQVEAVLVQSAVNIGLCNVLLFKKMLILMC